MRIGVVGFSRYRCVHFRAPWRSSGSSGVVGFTQVRSGCRWVHQLSWVSLERALEVVGLILRASFGSSVVGLGWLGSFACILRVVVFIEGGWVPSGAPWESLGSSRVIGFALARPVGSWVHSVSLIRLGALWGSSGSSTVFGFARLRPVDRWVRLESLGSLVCSMVFVGFNRDRWGHSGGLLC